MSDQDTLAVIATEIGSALEPVATALRSPQSFAAFMERLGWNFTAVPPALSALTAPAEQIALLLRDGGVSTGEIPQLLAAIANFSATVSAIPSQAASNFPAGLDVAAFKNEFPRQIIDYLVVDYLLRRQPGWGNLLKLAGVLRLEDVVASASRPAFTHRSIAWEDLGQFLSDPTLVLRNTYHWGQADFRDVALIGNIADVLDGWHIDYRFATVDPAIFNNLTAGALNPDNIFPNALRISLFEQIISGFGAEVGIELLILPPTAAALPGFAILPYAHGNFKEEISLTDEIFVQVRGEADFAGGIAIIMRPNWPVDLAVGFGGGTPTSASASVALALISRKSAGAEIVLIGSPTGTRLRAGSIAFRIGARLASADRKDLFLETEWTGAGLVIKPGSDDADSFLASLLPPDGFQINFDFTLGISTGRGVYFAGSGGLEINIPTHLQVGPIEIQSVLLAVRPAAGTIPISLGATIKGDLGPLKAVIEEIGLTANFVYPPDRKGNLGPVDFALGFKPPKGVGLSINAGAVSGGGYLFFDYNKEEYGGVLQLDLAKIVTVTAIGLITTRMPDGSKGFSLLLIITAEFGNGIQLGFGFTLLGVGGLLGLNRTMNLQALAEGVRTGALNNIMFPHDAIANAPRIISDLRNFFPPENGKFLIGPMVKLGWGTPTLVNLLLGIIIEIPGDIAIVGTLRMALPTNEAALIVLQVSFIGALEFDKQRVWFFATLFESRILYFTIEGDMGLLMAFGDDANFVLSVGGFHPQFNPPPLPFPSPRRISFSILNTPTQRIRVEGYFAVTSNTVQFGANAEMVLGFDDFGLEGRIGFDVLVQFSPFHFVARVSASVSLKAFGVGLFSVRLKFELSGPSGWRARGSGSISLLFFDISADFDISWGESRDTSLPPIAVIPLLTDEFNKPDNWKAELPAINNLLVSLRKLDPVTDVLVLHPVGTLRVSQKALPLDLNIDKVGTQKPSDAKRFSLEVLASGLGIAAAATEQFAIAQYQNMDDATKLSRPAYQALNGGVQLAVTGQQLKSSHAVRRIVRYEQIIIDNNFKRFPKRFSVFAPALFMHFLAGAAVSKSGLSVNCKTQVQPFKEKVTVAQEGYTVAFQANNKAFTPTATFSSEAAARDFMQQAIAEDLNRAELLHIIPHFEVTS